MKTAVVNLADGSFLARNRRWYKLTRTERKAPAPKVFDSKAKARAFVDFVKRKDFLSTNCNFVSPEKIKQKEPRKASIRTCGGRSSR